MITRRFATVMEQKFGSAALVMVFEKKIKFNWHENRGAAPTFIADFQTAFAFDFSTGRFG